MRTLRNTPDELVLQDRPWLLGGLLAVLILIFAGFGLQALLAGRLSGLLGLAGAGFWGVALVVFVRRTTLVFDRHAQQFRRDLTTLRQTSSTTWALAEVSHAAVESRTSRNSGKGRRGQTVLHRPVLHLTDGTAPIPLLDIFANGPAAADAAATINAWLGVNPASGHHTPPNT